ncbi:PLP-dependent transferase [Mycena vitilis]|nr:PLP-dependent transferase [Mycena vitilis]
MDCPNPTDSLPPTFHEFASASFLGPRAENIELLQELFTGVLNDHAVTRRRYHKDDEDFITADIKNSTHFKDTVDRLRTSVSNVSKLLSDYSVPFFSPRYMGHMCMEMSMPSMIGWLTTILYNPNNVAFEASPITTKLELEVGMQLCEMLGYYKPPDQIQAWGHIAADGTIANMESMWCVKFRSRNLKFYALSLHAAMTKGAKPLAFIAGDFKVLTCGAPDTPTLYRDLCPWQLLNLAPSVVLDIPDRILEQYGITAEFLADALAPYLAQTKGKEVLMDMYEVTLEPQYFVSSTKHYSWPKSAALLGIGSENCVNVPVDNDARVDVAELRAKLQKCVDTNQAVYAVVAVIGSTEEGAVDPLDEIIKLRTEFAQKGLSFLVHADAAWGGYFASMIRSLARAPAPGAQHKREYVPSVTLRQHTVDQFHALADADSITIDPHKAGYIPYPAGGLCYRDNRMRFLLTWSAPYLQQGRGGESIGIYGIEGSKPGAPAVACFLHHSVLGLHDRGHGALLGEVSFTCRRFGAHWAAMSDDKTEFIVVPFNPLENDTDRDIIRQHILGKSNEEIVRNAEAFDVLCKIASDLNINAFACNFRINGKVNEDVEEANHLNKRIFDRLSVTTPCTKPDDIPLFLSATTFAQADYGKCVVNFQRRMGLETESKQDLFVLRNVVMSPFQAAGDFVQELASIFQQVLEEEVKDAIRRNTVEPQIHEFIVQGLDKLYLTYIPRFHKANGRQQVVLGVNIPHTMKREYKTARQAHPASVFTLKTTDLTTIEQILAHKSFKASISSEAGAHIHSGLITITDIIKNRPLDSRWRDAHYPASYTPFYLYGTPNEINVDHMLLRAPNAQIASDLVALKVQPALTAAQLERGVIARVNRPEAAMQPFTTEHTVCPPGAVFAVEIFEDKQDAVAHGPGLADSDRLLAMGTLSFGKMVYVDCDKVNSEFESAMPVAKSVHGHKMSAKTRKHWSKVVTAGLGLPREDD